MKKMIGIVTLVFGVSQVYAETLADLYAGIEEVITGESNATVIADLKDALKALYPKLSAAGKKEVSEVVHKVWPEVKADTAGHYAAPARFTPELDVLLAKDKLSDVEVKDAARKIGDAYLKPMDVGVKAAFKAGAGL